MSKFLSRKLITMVGVWMYALGGVATGNITSDKGLEALGLTGVAYIVVQGLIDLIEVWRKRV